MSDLKGVEIHDVLGLSQPLKKLIETVSSGIGKVYKPVHIRRMAKARSAEISIISSTINGNLQLPIKYDSGEVIIDAINANELVQRAQTRFLYQEMRKQQNIESVIGNAYKELESIDAVNPDPVDDDWINVFFDSVANISTEQMQTLWGKLLAGEITEPGSFSLRTLATLKNLTGKEAALFQKIIPYIFICPGDRAKSFEDYFLLCNNDICVKYNISFPDIVLLNEAGLISSNGRIRAGVSLKPNQSEMIVCKSINKAIKIKNMENTESHMFHPSYILTEIGKALVPIALDYNVQPPPDSYLLDCMYAMKNHVFRYEFDTVTDFNRKVSMEIVNL